MVEVAKSMRLTLCRPPRGKVPKDGLQDQHKKASLVLPLATYDQLRDRPKRKKMR